MIVSSVLLTELSYKTTGTVTIIRQSMHIGLSIKKSVGLAVRGAALGEENQPGVCATQGMEVRGNGEKKLHAKLYCCMVLSVYVQPLREESLSCLLYR